MILQGTQAQDETSTRRLSPIGITIAAALGLAILTITVLVASFDLRERPLVGDEASHVLQALSLAYDGNLSYDQGDLDRFEALGWRGAETPKGIFFQRYDHGWAFAKPYGWSLVAAPFVRVFGPFPGLAVASAALVLTTLGAAWVACRPAGRAAAVFGVISVLASVTWLYGFSAHSDLFLAALMALIAAAYSRAFAARNVSWLYVAAALSAVALAEKPPFAAVLVPVFLIALARTPQRRHQAGLVAALAGVFAIAVLPYLVYSSFESWNPYSGQRFYRSDGLLPFAPGAPPVNEYKMVTSTESFSASVIIDRATDDPGAGLRSIAGSVIGQHTGLIAFLPLTAIALVFALRRGWRGERAAIGAAVGVLAYLAIYAFVFPKNYFGGEQSLGNRYLVQVSPMALLGIAALPPSRRQLIWGAAGGSALAALFLWPQFARPTEAFVHLDRSTMARDLLPEEPGIVGTRLYDCGIPAVMWGLYETTPEAIERIAEQETCLERTGHRVP